jgi:uncharacterized membrane-anchored protein
MMPPRRTVAFWLAVAAQVAVLVAVPLPKALTLRSGRTVFLQVIPAEPPGAMRGYATLSYDASLPGAYHSEGPHGAEQTTQSLLREYMAVMTLGPTTSTMAQLGLTMADLRADYPRARVREGGGRDAHARDPAQRVLGRDGLLTTDALEGIRERAKWSRLGDEARTPYSDGDMVYAVLEERSGGEPWRPVRLSRGQPASLPSNQVALRARFVRSRIVFGLEQFYIAEVERRDVDLELRENTRNARAEIRVDASGNSALVALHIGNRTWRLK